MATSASTATPANVSSCGGAPSRMWLMEYQRPSPFLLLNDGQGTGNSYAISG
jgi:hypothetical protein